MITKLTEAIEKVAGKKNPILSLEAKRMETENDERIIVNVVVRVSKKRKKKIKDTNTPKEGAGGTD